MEQATIHIEYARHRCHPRFLRTSNLRTREWIIIAIKTYDEMKMPIELHLHVVHGTVIVLQILKTYYYIMWAFLHMIYECVLHYTYIYHLYANRLMFV